MELLYKMKSTFPSPKPQEPDEKSLSFPDHLRPLRSLMAEVLFKISTKLLTNRTFKTFFYIVIVTFLEKPFETFNERQTFCRRALPPS